MTKLILILTFASILLSSANLVGAQDTPDWCYQFDFALDDYDITPVYGSWQEGKGFITDSAGRLRLHYSHTGMVRATRIIIMWERANSSYGPIHLALHYDLFGNTWGPLQTDTSPDVARWNTQFPGAGEEPGQGRDIDIDVTSSIPIRLTMIDLQGQYDSPFLAFDCTDTYHYPVPYLSNLIDIVKQADDAFHGVNVPLESPDGSPLLPNETGSTIFGYAKWLLSPATAEEIAGPFAPIVSALGFLIIAEITLLGVYGVVYIAMYLVRWVVWIFKLLMAVIQTIAAIIDTAVGKIIGAIFKFIGG